MAVIFILASGGFTFAAAAAKESGKVIQAKDPNKVPASAKGRDTLIVGSASWNGVFNPIYSSSVYDSWAMTLIYDGGLMTNDDAGNPIKYMATDYSISKDGKTYTFKINKNIKFSNGDPVTAQDFANTYNALADPKYDGPRMDAVENLAGYQEYHKGYAKTFKAIKVIDDYTISFTEQNIKASALLQDFIYAPLNHKVFAFKKGGVAMMKKLYETGVGAGPYKLVKNVPGQYISFAKNENYWKGAPKIEKVIMKLTNSSNNIQEITTGGTDIDKIGAKVKNIEMLSAAGFLDLHLYIANAYSYMGLNLRNPKLADKRVRQAIMYGINRAGFVKAYYSDYGSVCNAPVSPVSWAYTEDVNQYAYDAKKADSLLDAAGWKKNSDGYRYKDGTKFTLNYMTSTGSAYYDTLIPIAKENLKAIGIDLVVEQMEFSTLSDKVFKDRKFEAYSMGWSLSIDPDPSGIFSKSQDVPNGFNSVGWVNPVSEQLMKAGLKEPDQAKRKAIYQKWVKLANEELPYVFLSQANDMYVVSSRVKNAHYGPYRDWTVEIEKLELAK